MIHYQPPSISGCYNFRSRLSGHSLALSKRPTCTCPKSHIRCSFSMVCDTTSKYMSNDWVNLQMIGRTLRPLEHIYLKRTTKWTGKLRPRVFYWSSDCNELPLLFVAFILSAAAVFNQMFVLVPVLKIYVRKSDNIEQLSKGVQYTYLSPIMSS